MRHQPRGALTLEISSEGASWRATARCLRSAREHVLILKRTGWRRISVEVIDSTGNVVAYHDPNTGAWRT